MSAARSSTPPLPPGQIAARLKTMREELEDSLGGIPDDSTRRLTDPLVNRALLAVEQRAAVEAQSSSQITCIQIETWRHRAEAKLSPQARKELEEHRARNQAALEKSVAETDEARQAERRRRIAALRLDAHDRRGGFR